MIQLLIFLQEQKIEKSARSSLPEITYLRSYMDKVRTACDRLDRNSPVTEIDGVTIRPGAHVIDIDTMPLLQNLLKGNSFEQPGMFF